MATSALKAVISMILFSTALAEPAVQVVTSKFDTCLNYQHQVACWGANLYGELGRGDTDSFGAHASDIELALFPIDLGEDFIVKSIFGGSVAHFCALSVENWLKCWGLDNQGT